jgi:hypothetical protein
MSRERDQVSVITVAGKCFLKKGAANSGLHPLSVTPIGFKCHWRPQSCGRGATNRPGPFAPLHRASPYKGVKQVEQWSRNRALRAVERSTSAPPLLHLQCKMILSPLVDGSAAGSAG